LFRVTRHFSRLFPVLAIVLLGPLTLFAQGSSVKIGLLIPDESSSEIIHATSLAIGQANESGGVNGIPFEMVVRTTEGPWGVGSRESVSLIYDDSVCAMLCALDGRNAHLAEQVAAKTHVACIETRATDPTLTQAYVPWFMRVVPNDHQQSREILQCVNRSTIGKLAILSTGAYDARMAAQSLTRMAALSGAASPEIIMVQPDLQDPDLVADRIRNKQIRHLVITFHSKAVQGLTSQLILKEPELEIYGMHGFTAGISFQHPAWSNFEGLWLVSAHILCSSTGKEFMEKFNDRFGYTPGVSAAYAYDGMNLILEAIRTTGAEREAIREFLSGIEYLKGVTGSIAFDELGNRTGSARLTRIQDGQPCIRQSR